MVSVKLSSTVNALRTQGSNGPVISCKPPPGFVYLPRGFESAVRVPGMTLSMAAGRQVRMRVHVGIVVSLSLELRGVARRVETYMQLLRLDAARQYEVRDGVG